MGFYVGFARISVLDLRKSTADLRREFTADLWNKPTADLLREFRADLQTFRADLREFRADVREFTAGLRERARNGRNSRGCAEMFSSSAVEHDHIRGKFAAGPGYFERFCSLYCCNLQTPQKKKKKKRCLCVYPASLP